MTLWPFPDRAGGATGAAPPSRVAALPGPLGLLAYARLRVTGADLPQRLRLLIGQLAAERSGCAWCALSNRHLARKAGISTGELDGVLCHQTAPGFSNPERAALALAEAITGFSEARGGFSPEVLGQARRHLEETEIMAVVGVVTAEHFFDARTGLMGQDVLTPVSTD